MAIAVDFNLATIQTMREIHADTQKRKEQAVADPSQLDGGIWYPSEYFQTLKARGCL